MNDSAGRRVNIFNDESTTHIKIDVARDSHHNMTESSGSFELEKLLKEESKLDSSS